MLKHVHDKNPGIVRIKRGKGFGYNYKNAPISLKTKERINALKIPPAWTHVWICPSANGHIQATGLDAQGKKQYIYHQEWINHHQQHKFDDMVTFGYALDTIRKKTKKDLSSSNLTKSKVLAAIVEIMDHWGLRVGNNKNKAYGITTITKNHARLHKGILVLDYHAKSGKQRHVEIQDQQLIAIIKALTHLPGFHIFKYIDDQKKLHDITSKQVNSYLQDMTNMHITSKSFRTWLGSTAYFEHALEMKSTHAIKQVANKLNNTVSVCKNYYIHPKVIEHHDSLPKYLNNIDKYNHLQLHKIEKGFLNLLEH